MRNLRLKVFLLVFLVSGYVYSLDVSFSFAASAATLPIQIADDSSRTEPIPLKPAEMSGKSASERADNPKKSNPATSDPAKDDRTAEETPEASAPSESVKPPEADEENYTEDSNDLGSDYVPEEGEVAPATISDPIEPFNRAMYHFNDKLYFWLLKPVSQAYGKVVPERARSSVQNFFSNLAFPIRFLSCLFQADFRGAAKEAGRFTVNTLWGMGGFLDPSAKEELDIPKQNVDLGQTLGVYGVGHGFYIVWPIFGPSSLRDTVDIAGEFVLYPVSYLSPWYASVAVRSYEKINDTSLRIGDYEALKGAAIDPYLSIRDAFVQYRKNKVDARKSKAKQLQSEEGGRQQ
ncbi:MAG: putative phospholipid-binding lipoprotein MlaA precursor [Syntrophus sp. PtaB.Bin001]|nr:MAG: putative phospholipid-binding lipoprotein MlaA precursor [Syntrophus sp. PtaB.Bin001]